MSQLQEIREQRPVGEVLGEATTDGLLIQGAALLGKFSENGRTYTDQAMKEAVELYAGTKLFLDHPTRRELKDRQGQRSVRDLVGRVRNPRKAGDRVKGDLEILDREPTKSLVLSLAKQMPEAAGLSHRARGEVEVDGSGQQVVKSLAEVFALELVTEPATVSGLLESLDRRKDREREVREALIERGVPEEVARENPTAEWIAGIDDPEARAQAVKEAVKARRTRQQEITVSRRGFLSSRQRERDPDDVFDRGEPRSNGSPGRISDDDVDDAFRRLF